MRTFLLWILTIVIALSTMVYQRMTGPTYPKKVDIELNNQKYNLALLRSNEIGTPCEIIVEIENNAVSGVLHFKRYNTSDEWQVVDMQRKTINKKAFFGKGKEISVLYGTLPEQPAAGKVEYYFELKEGDQTVTVAEDSPVIVRFKGMVPRYILYPHILFMIISLLLGVRTGVEVLAKGKNQIRFTMITIISLGIGGLVLGPMVQFHAFGEYWTGWPFGSDWTDNKTLFAFIFWVIAYYVLKRKPENKLWPIIALLVLFSVYLIPHSMGGSELNPETGKVETGLKK